MGTLRCPLYTLPNGLGFPAFLQHQYIGTSRTQLVQTIQRRGLLMAQEIQAALEVRASIINWFSDRRRQVGLNDKMMFLLQKSMEHPGGAAAT